MIWRSLNEIMSERQWRLKDEYTTSQTRARDVQIADRIHSMLLRKRNTADFLWKADHWTRGSPHKHGNENKQHVSLDRLHSALSHLQPTESWEKYHYYEQLSDKKRSSSSEMKCAQLLWLTTQLNLLWNNRPVTSANRIVFDCNRNTRKGWATAVLWCQTTPT